MNGRIECLYDELVKLEQIIEHPGNENQHNEKQIEALAKIIAKVGMRQAIVVSKRSGRIVKGHGRKEALKLLGWDSAPVQYQAYESELEELNDRVADNEIARYAEFDFMQFEQNLKEFELELGDVDLDEFGLLDKFEQDWDSDIESVEKATGNLSGLDPRVIITCQKDDYDELLIYIKDKLLETSFEGVHVK